VSFLSLSWSIVADLDIESEKWRCCGSFRFTWGAIVRTCGLRKYRGRLWYLPVEGEEEGEGGVCARGGTEGGRELREIAAGTGGAGAGEGKGNKEGKGEGDSDALIHIKDPVAVEGDVDAADDGGGETKEGGGRGGGGALDDAIFGGEAGSGFTVVPPLTESLLPKVRHGSAWVDMGV
jgi:hypothetical protein